jgi:hypothetical protein
MGQICSTSSKAELSPPASPRFTRLSSSPRASISREAADASLLSTCVGAVASGCERLDVSSLPDDLAQLVFERLQESGALTMAKLRRFDPSSLYRASLGGIDVDDAWLAALGRCMQLRELALPSCSTLVRRDRLPDGDRLPPLPTTHVKRGPLHPTNRCAPPAAAAAGDGGGPGAPARAAPPHAPGAGQLPRRDRRLALQRQRCAGRTLAGRASWPLYPRLSPATRRCFGEPLAAAHYPAQACRCCGGCRCAAATCWRAPGCSTWRSWRSWWSWTCSSAAGGRSWPGCWLRWFWRRRRCGRAPAVAACARYSVAGLAAPLCASPRLLPPRATQAARRAAAPGPAAAAAHAAAGRLLPAAWAAGATPRAAGRPHPP